MRYLFVPVVDAVELPPVSLLDDVGTEVSVVDDQGRPLPAAAVYVENADGTVWRDAASDGWAPDLRAARTDARGRAVLVENPRRDLEALPARRWLSSRLEPRSVVSASGWSGPRRTSAVARRLSVLDASGAPVVDALVAFADRTWPVARTDAHGMASFIGGLMLQEDGTEAVGLLIFAADGRVASFRATAELRSCRVVCDPARPSSSLAAACSSLAVVLSPARWFGLRPTPDVPSSPTRRGSGRWRCPVAATFASRPTRPATRLVRPTFHGPRARPRWTWFCRRLASSEDACSVRMGRRGLESWWRPGTKHHPTWGCGVSTGPPAAPSPQIDGTFRLGTLDLGRRHAVLATDGTHEAWARSVPAVDRVGDATADPALEIILPSGRVGYGAVVDAEDRPLADASIVVRPVESTAASSVPESATPSATSGSDGRFEIGRLEAGPVDVEVSAKGRAPVTVRGLLVPADETTVDLGTFVLIPGAVVSGRVNDPEGVAVAGASVRLTNDDGVPDALLHHRMAALAEATVVDGHGRFSVAETVAGRPTAIRVEAPGFLPRHLRGLVPPTDPSLEVELQPAATIRGQVLDARGAAVVNAEVVAETLPSDAEQGNDAGGESAGAMTDSARSDGDGRFVLQAVAPGQVVLSATARDLLAARLPPRTMVARQAIDDVVLRLGDGVVVGAMVTDVEGRPIVGADVRIGAAHSETRDDGLATLRGVATGWQDLLVQGFGYGTERREVEITGSTELRIELDGGHAVRGRVVDVEGRAVSGVDVRLVGGMLGEERTYQAPSSPGGDFEIAPVADAGYRVEVVGDGWTVLEPTEIMVAASVDRLEVVAARGGRIEGAVVGLSFEELERVTVEGRHHEGRTWRGEVDYAGSYALVDLPAGGWVVTATVAGGRRQARLRVALPPDTARVERDLIFGEGAVLDGRVWLDEQPLAGASVSLGGIDVAVERTATTEEGGSFTFEDLPPGRYRLGVVARASGVVHNDIVDAFDDRTIDVMVHSARVGGWVTAADSGQPLDDALISLRRQLGADDGGLTTAATDTRGRFDSARLSPGRYRLQVARQGYEPADRVLDVVAGETSEVAFSLEPTPGLVLAVRTGDGGQPLWVHLRAYDGRGMLVLAETRQRGPDGTTRFATLPAGDWRLVVGASEAGTTTLQASVPGDAHEVVLPAAGRLVVRVAALVESDAVGAVAVAGTDGRPFQAFAMGGALVDQWPLIGGRAVIEGVPAGQWTIRAEAVDGQAWSGAVVTTGGPDVGVALE